MNSRNRRTRVTSPHLLRALVVGLVLAWAAARADDKVVLAAARSFPDGGGYDGGSGGHGVPEDVVHKGTVILSKAKSRRGSYCCGFTFAVVMKAAAWKGLLADKTVAQVRRFQQEWYGATKASRERQCAMAVVNLGIGREVKLKDARPGDCMILCRANSSGHSVVFLGWVWKARRRVGIRYRSSQPYTKGIGDLTEYFAGLDGRTQGIDPKRTHVARLSKGRRKAR